MINILKNHHQCLGCWSLISHFQLVEDSSTVVGRKNAFDLVESGKMKIYLEKSPAIDSPGKTGRRGKGRREDSTFEAALLGTEKIHQHLFVLLQQNHRWRKKIARTTFFWYHGWFLFSILQCYLTNSIFNKSQIKTYILKASFQYYQLFWTEFSFMKSRIQQRFRF